MLWNLNYCGGKSILSGGKFPVAKPGVCGDGTQGGNQEAIQSNSTLRMWVDQLKLIVSLL